MNDINPLNGGRPAGGFSADIATDLASGRAVDLAEVYALHALDDGERDAVDRYLSSAPAAERAEFEERVRQARETLAMSFTAEEEPPAGLFDKISAALPTAASASTPATPEPGTPESGAPVVALPGASAPVVVRPVRDAAQATGTDDLAAARDRREQRRRPQGMRTWLIGVAAAAAVAVGGVGVGAYIANQNDPMAQVLQAGDVKKETIDVIGGGTASLTLSSSKDAVVVKMNGVPAPPSGKVYQMWLIPKDGSAPVSKGLMDAEALSKPAVVTGIGSAAALGITVEPVGGSKTPTMPTVAAASLGA